MHGSDHLEHLCRIDPFSSALIALGHKFTNRREFIFEKKKRGNNSKRSETEDPFEKRERRVELSQSSVGARRDSELQANRYKNERIPTSLFSLSLPIYFCVRILISISISIISIILYLLSNLYLYLYLIIILRKINEFATSSPDQHLALYEAKICTNHQEVDSYSIHTSVLIPSCVHAMYTNFESNILSRCRGTLLQPPN